jgi:hypothetical protein
MFMHAEEHKGMGPLDRYGIIARLRYKADIFLYRIE